MKTIFMVGGALLLGVILGYVIFVWTGSGNETDPNGSMYNSFEQNYFIQTKPSSNESFNTQSFKQQPFKQEPFKIDN